MEPDKQRQRRRIRRPDIVGILIGLAGIVAIFVAIFLVSLILVVVVVLLMKIRGFTVSIREDWDYLLTFALMFALLSAFSTSTAAIASNKHRRVDGWCILGFFLGPIAILIVALLPELETSYPSKQCHHSIPLYDDIIKTRNAAPLEGDPTAWPCPKCGAVNPGNTYVCKQCKFRLK